MQFINDIPGPGARIAESFGTGLKSTLENLAKQKANEIAREKEYQYRSKLQKEKYQYETQKKQAEVVNTARAIKTADPTITDEAAINLAQDPSIAKLFMKNAAAERENVSFADMINRQRGATTPMVGSGTGIANANPSDILETAQTGGMNDNLKQDLGMPVVNPGETTTPTGGQQVKQPLPAMSPEKMKIYLEQEAAAREAAAKEQENFIKEQKAIQPAITKLLTEKEALDTDKTRLAIMKSAVDSGKTNDPNYLQALNFLGLKQLKHATSEESQLFEKNRSDYVADASKVLGARGMVKSILDTYMASLPDLMQSRSATRLVIKNRELINKAKSLKFNEFNKMLTEYNGKLPVNFEVLLYQRVNEKMEPLREKIVKTMEQAMKVAHLPMDKQLEFEKLIEKDKKAKKLEKKGLAENREGFRDPSKYQGYTYDDEESGKPVAVSVERNKGKGDWYWKDL